MQDQTEEKAEAAGQSHQVRDLIARRHSSRPRSDVPPGARAVGKRAVIVGGGFTGLSAAYELTRNGFSVEVLERDEVVGGLAASFPVGGTRLERYYHHWFTGDRHVLQLIRELGLQTEVVVRPARTGVWYKDRIHRLSTPWDLLTFTPLRFTDRLRLGRLVWQARRIKDWKSLESMTAEEWLIGLGGEGGYSAVWEPLMRGKFGDQAPDLSAAWIWNKLKLRGGSRGRGGRELLMYLRGGFAALTDRLVAAVEAGGGHVHTGKQATGLQVRGGRVTGVLCGSELREADQVLVTPALPIVAELVREHVDKGYYKRLCAIRYLANVCLILELDRRLSDTYWLNVVDAGFPYVGVIEHTNFEPPETYDGRHIVYLSRYLLADDSLYRQSDEDLFACFLWHLKRMFPCFSANCVQRHHVWRAEYAQPIVARHYRQLIPEHRMPVENLWLCTMAQIYPEDRGTNHAVRDGRKVAQAMAAQRNGRQ